MRGKVAQVEKAHRHRYIADVLAAGRRSDQASTHRIQAQVSQVLNRAHAGHRLETVLQGPPAHPQLFAQVENAQWRIAAGIDQLLTTLDQVGTHGEIAAPATHLIGGVAEQVQEGAKQFVFEAPKGVDVIQE